MELNLLITRLFSSSLNEIYNNSSLYIYYITDLHFEFIQNYWIALYIYISYIDLPLNPFPSFNLKYLTVSRRRFTFPPVLTKKASQWITVNHKHNLAFNLVLPFFSRLIYIFLQSSTCYVKWMNNECFK